MNMRRPTKLRPSLQSGGPAHPFLAASLRRVFSLTLVAVCVTLLAPHGTRADSSTLAATQDAWIDASHPTQNKGNDTKLRVRSSGPVRRALVQFDLATIPACATVTSA